MEKMITRLTGEQISEAKKNGQAVIYGEQDGELVPIRILSKEQTREEDANWDDEFHCPKGVAEFWGRARAYSSVKKGKGRASVGRAFIDIYGAIKALENIYGFLTDDEEHGLAEYSRAASTVSRTLAIGTGWMGNAFGYWSTVVAIATNPIDFAARVWRNMKHYYGEE